MCIKVSLKKFPRISLRHTSVRSAPVSPRASPHPRPLPPPPPLRRRTSPPRATLSSSRLRWKGGWNDGCDHGGQARGRGVHLGRGTLSLLGRGAKIVSIFTFFYRPPPPPPPPPLAEIYKEQKIQRGREGRGVDIRRGWNREANPGKE